MYIKGKTDKNQARNQKGSQKRGTNKKFSKQERKERKIKEISLLLFLNSCTRCHVQKILKNTKIKRRMNYLKNKKRRHLNKKETMKEKMYEKKEERKKERKEGRKKDRKRQRQKDTRSLNREGPQKNSCKMRNSRL